MLKAVQDGLRDFAFRTQLPVQRLQLVPVGQLPVPEQVQHLFEADVRSQILDVVPAINELALLAVDKADFRLECNHPFQAAHLLCLHCRFGRGLRYFGSGRHIQNARHHTSLLCDPSTQLWQSVRAGQDLVFMNLVLNVCVYIEHRPKKRSKY